MMKIAKYLSKLNFNICILCYSMLDHFLFFSVSNGCFCNIDCVKEYQMSDLLPFKY
jgi:hypothetical protein